jgi:hypothetical protein
VVIAAKVRSRGREALPVIESKLRSLDIYSAWRLLPDWQVGIVHVTSDEQLDKVVAFTVSDGSRPCRGERAIQRSARDAAGSAFRQVTLLGRPDHSSPVAVFDGTILATAALVAPEVMVKLAGSALACFGDLPDEEREILFETFRVWQETDAAVGAARSRSIAGSSNRFAWGVLRVMVVGL